MCQGIYDLRKHASVEKIERRRPWDNYTSTKAVSDVFLAPRKGCEGRLLSRVFSGVW
jgi:hypothetical protein